MMCTPTVRLVQLSARLLAGAFLCSLSAPGLVVAQEGGVAKENLDLPYDAIGSNEEEEDAPEIVSFYGQSLEGDGFFYVIDDSGSMRDSGELNVAKREVIKNIGEFSERVQFGIVFFDAAVKKFPSSGQPADANPGMKSAGISFVQSIQGAGGSCCQAGFTAVLNIANQSSSKRKVVVYLGDGGGTCQGADETDYLRKTLTGISAQNWQRVQINTVGVLALPALNEKFLKDVAASNGGTYTRITR